jgi:hypothetical protein
MPHERLLFDAATATAQRLNGSKPNQSFPGRCAVMAARRFHTSRLATFREVVQKAAAAHFLIWARHTHSDLGPVAVEHCKTPSISFGATSENTKHVPLL